MSIRQLRPWQRIPEYATCARCRRQATHRAEGSRLTPAVEAGDGTFEISLENLPVAELACDMHIREVMDEVFEAHGGASGRPIRLPWRSWFLFEFPLTRWTGRIEVAIHNWRFDRRTLRIMACQHQVNEDGYCPLCNCTFHGFWP